MAGLELEITVDLSDALSWVLGAALTAPEPVVVAAYLDSLAKGFGLSESGQIDEDPLERADPPAPAVALINHFLAEGEAEMNADTLRDRLYDVFVGLALDLAARRILNKNQPLSEVGLLRLGQIYWNLEARGLRTKLPIQPGRITTTGTTGSKQIEADIKVPNANKDFATMTWTARVNEQGTYKSSGQGFRKQGARLAVLAAELIVNSCSKPAPALEGAVLNRTSADGGTPRISSITWPEPEPAAVTPAISLAAAVATIANSQTSPVPEQSSELTQLRDDRHRVLIGGLAEVGAGYQRRGFDAEIERLWADGGGDRRLWLRGGPGLGKSYSARRAMQDAVANQSENREDLLIWVDSADVDSMTETLATAVDRLREQGFTVPVGAKDTAKRKARALLELLATSTWRWLIVLDNADAGSLIEAGLIPPGGNPHGRVLITTLSQDHRLRSHGRVVQAALFTAEEAETYLRNEIHSIRGDPAPLALAPRAETEALAQAVGYHPLALSIASATIVAHAMDVADWLSEFAAAEEMDAAADAVDQGGYPHLIGATWQVALDKASRGLPNGVVERAALVAALQDPDGHPTWLWDSDALTRWIDGGSALARHHGVPVAVQRLIDHSIVELRGDSWKQGQAAIHPLAARAVREHADSAMVAELAAALADAWLVQLTDPRAATQPRDIRRNLEPIAALPDLPAPTKQTVAALLGYAQRPNPIVLAWFAENLEVLATHLEQGGAIGRARLADEYVSIAEDEEELGRLVEARARLTQAAQIYQQIVDDATVHDELRAACLKGLGEVQEKVGQRDHAQKSFTRAARIYERLTETDTAGSDLGSHLVALVELHDKLGNLDQKNALLVRADELLQGAADGDPTGADEAALYQRAAAWTKLAEQLRALGRPSEAKEFLARAAESYQQAGIEHLQHNALRSLARLHIQTSHWDEAEDCLAGLVADEYVDAGDLVLLASIQTREGRTDEQAAKNLARAAEQYRERGSGDDDGPRERPPELREVQEMVNRVTLRKLSVDAMNRQRWTDAIGLSRVVLDLTQKRAEGNPGDHEEELADAHHGLGINYLQDGRLKEAVDHCTRSVHIRQLLAELDPSNEKAQRDLADALLLLGLALHKLGRPEDAVDCLRRAVDLYQPTGPAPTDHETKKQLGFGLTVLAGSYRELGLVDEAIDCHDRHIALWQTAADHAAGDHDTERGLADACFGLGRMYLLDVGRWDEAIDLLTRSASIREVLADHDPGDHEAQQHLAEALIMLGLTHTQLGRDEEAVDVLSRAVTRTQMLAELDSNDHEAQQSHAEVLGLLGEAYSRLDRLDESADCLRRSANILSLLADLNPGNHESLLIQLLRQLEDVLRRLGRVDEADDASARADDIARSLPDPGIDDEG